MTKSRVFHHVTFFDSFIVPLCFLRLLLVFLLFIDIQFRTINISVLKSADFVLLWFFVIEKQTYCSLDCNFISWSIFEHLTLEFLYNSDSNSKNHCRFRMPWMRLRRYHDTVTSSLIFIFYIFEYSRQICYGVHGISVLAIQTQVLVKYFCVYNSTNNNDI